MGSPRADAIRVEPGRVSLSHHAKSPGTEFRAAPVERCLVHSACFIPGNTQLGRKPTLARQLLFGLRGGLGFRGIFNHQRHVQRQQAASTSAMPSVDKRLKGLEPRPTTNSPQLGGNAAKMKASETWLVVGSHRNERPSQDVRSCRRTKIPTAAWPSETGCSSA